MPPRIVDKLRIHLSKPVNDEAAVVYLLAGLRKLLERDAQAHSKGALWMYIHWALHVNLKKAATTMDFLKRVDRWVTNRVAHLTPIGTWDLSEEYDLFKDFIFLDTFREQLRHSLLQYGLPPSICDIDQDWYAFVEAYAGVIEDGSLSTASDRNNELGAVKRVIFNKGKNLSINHRPSFVIVWSIELKDGRTLIAEVETVPNGDGKMRAHHLKLLNGSFVPPA